MLARLAHIDLTTVSQNPGEQADRAVAAVVQRLDGGRTEARSAVLTPQLVIRATTAPPRDSTSRESASGARREDAAARRDIEIV